MSGPGKIVSGLPAMLYADLRAAIVGSVRAVARIVADANREHFPDIESIREAVTTGRMKNGQRITLYCKPSPFGPFLRRHFLSPIIGHRSDLRLGPPLMGTHPLVGMLAQVTSHYMPVGLYPSVGAGVVQASLFASDAATCGMIGLLPFLSGLSPHIPVLLRTEQAKYYGVPCILQGAMRLLDPADYEALGLGAEDYEIHRQQGELWFVDATEETDEWRLPTGDQVQPIWGGLYSQGHLELGAPQKMSPVDLVDVIVASAKRHGFDTLVSQNQAGAKEIGIYGRGFRALVSSHAPVYSLHMDAELTAGYGAARATFDAIVGDVLTGVRDLANAKAAALANPHDLDFTYTNSTSSFRVLRSAEADAIAEPATILVREWHRRRSTK